MRVKEFREFRIGGERQKAGPLMAGWLRCERWDAQVSAPFFQFVF